MSTSSEDLRAIALAEFTSAGYGATSIHRIAEIAGLSKSSVLYHYSSKETLLEAAVAPAIDRMGEILDELAAGPFTPARRAAFLGEFVDFILQFRREVNLFINQGPSLVDVPVIDRANEMVLRLAEYFAATTGTIEDKMRFGIALGGAAYTLCSQEGFGYEIPVDETRTALVTILSELLAPIPVATLVGAPETTQE